MNTEFFDQVMTYFLILLCFSIAMFLWKYRHKIGAIDCPHCLKKASAESPSMFRDGHCHECKKIIKLENSKIYSGCPGPIKIATSCNQAGALAPDPNH